MTPNATIVENSCSSAPTVVCGRKAPHARTVGHSRRRAIRRARHALNRLCLLTCASLIGWIAGPDGRLEGQVLSDFSPSGHGAFFAPEPWEPASFFAAYPVLLPLSGPEENVSPPVTPGNRKNESTYRSPEGRGQVEKMDLLLYRGHMVSNPFGKIVLRQQRDYVPSFIRVAALNYKLGDFYGPFTWEYEGQFAKHDGLQNHSEINAVLIARWEVRWKELLSFSWAIGDGLSVASQVPSTEKEENSTAGAAANYLMTEIDIGLPSLAFHPRLMFRIHHRSGVFGLTCRETCGSNILTFGLKIAR